METYYSLLGISPVATDAEIKSAYRKLAKRFHPDANPQVTDAVRRVTEEKFKEVQEAYDVLRNSSKRAQYDGLLAKQFPRQAPPTPRPRPVPSAQYQGPPIAHWQKNSTTMPWTRIAVTVGIMALEWIMALSSTPLSINSWTPSVALHEKFGQIDKNHGYPILADNGAKLAVAPNAPGQGNLVSLLTSIWGLPESGSSEANRLEADARNVLRQGDRSAAVSTLKRALEVDPKFTRARIQLATVYMALGQSDSALDALRKAIDSDPKQLVARKTYGFVLLALRRWDTAIDAWREAVKIAPDDTEANAALGMLLLQQKHYGEALPYLETAAKHDTSPAAQNRLGAAYVQAGQIEKGTVILEKVVEANPGPEMWNDVGYELADANVGQPGGLPVPRAWSFSDRATAFARGRTLVVPQHWVHTPGAMLSLGIGLGLLLVFSNWVIGYFSAINCPAWGRSLLSLGGNSNITQDAKSSKGRAV